MPTGAAFMRAFRVMQSVPIRCLALGMSILICQAMGAQVTAVSAAGRPGATRAELESLAARAAEVASSPTASAKLRAEKHREAGALRARLREGDFEIGDRIVVTVPRDSALSDTFAVQPGRTLNLPDIPVLPLSGVLRSELQAHLVAQIARFVKDTTLKATALVRFGVLGEVARPGYYRLPADIPISDAIMAAGGPTARADVPGTVVRRGSKRFLSKRAVRNAMVAGLTLDQLNLGPGDEIVVAEKRERGWRAIAQVAAVASGILLAVRSVGLF